jgi:hypothetical protein
MYADANSTYDEATAKFDEAQAAGDKADKYQLALLIFAVALSLAAWASIVHEDSKLRPAFAVVALILGLYGLITFIQILTLA